MWEIEGVNLKTFSRQDRKGSDINFTKKQFNLGELCAFAREYSG